MSNLALSALVRPSRLFAGCTLSFGLVCILLTVRVVMDQSGTFSLTVKLLTGLACLLTLICLFFAWSRSKKAFRIDLSGSGYIHISEDRGDVSALPATEGEDASDTVYYLAAGSTVWPKLLLLRLKTEKGAKRTVRIFPDSVSTEEFQALYVAFNWLSGR